MVEAIALTVGFVCISFIGHMLYTQGKLDGEAACGDCAERERRDRISFKKASFKKELESEYSLKRRRK
jgi:hypothetical protein